MNSQRSKRRLSPDELDRLTIWSRAVGRRWRVDPSDLYQEGVICWLTQPADTPSKLAASRAYWVMVKFCAVHHYGSLAAYMAHKRASGGHEAAKRKACYLRDKSLRVKMAYLDGHWKEVKP